MTMQALFIVLLATGAIAAPYRAFDTGNKVRSQEACSKKIRFPYGKELTYNYVGETVSSVNGSSTARSALKINARCVIKTVGACEHVLKVDSVELWEGQSKNLPLEYRRSRENAAFARELQAHELIFRSRNGLIVEVLSSHDETPQALNIKKGILSALQVQFTKGHSLTNETDVAGKCPVYYKIHSKYLNGRVKVVSKTRHLNACSSRSKTDLGIHVQQYNEKALQLLSSSSNCRYLLGAKKRIQKVVCQEKHLFRPFSSGNSAAATTTTRQVLELQSVDKRPLNWEAGRAKAFTSSLLLYEHNKPDSNSSLASAKVKEIIQQLASQSIEETRPESARQFSRLIFHLRKLDSEAVEKLWEEISKCEKFDVCTYEQKDKIQMYLLDALPHCGTSGCALVMTRAIERSLVNSERGNMFLTGLALVSVPTKDMISHVLRLCQTESSRTCMLTLGTLMHKYCEIGKCESLQDNNPVVKAELWLQGLLGKKCDFNDALKAEKIIMALKSIGNAGRPSSEAAKLILLKCVNNPNLPMNMTIAAINALRRMPCNDQTTEELLNVYANRNFDVEIRIESYLALLRCPSVDLFKRIVKIQDLEVNNQVGSFVWSHITNAMESSEPLHGRPIANMIREALGKKALREFNMNRLRFSRAWEGSFYNDFLRAGGSVQGHVIYHPNSYLPRSTRVNLTMDVLGASVNVLEAAARFEGLEILVEQMFGRDGYYPDNRIMSMFDGLKPHSQREDEEKPIRGKRNIEDINKVETHLNELHEKMDSRKHTPSGAVSVNLFGNEMRVASFDDINWLQSEADNINMVDFLIKLARGGNKTFTKSMMFLDVETTVPTILGLPLKLDAKGTSVVSVLMNGKLDIRNMFWGPMAFDIRGYLKPSAVVEVTGSMGVNAVFAEAGILLNTSFYTTTELRGNATYKQGQIMKFEIGSPSKPVQIFNVSSSLFATLNEEEIKIRGTQRRFEPAPCVNLTRVLGLAVCGQMSLPIGYRDIQSPFFPLSGPASFSLSVIPTDPKLRLYQIIAQRLPTDDESDFDFMARISTPNATWEREFEANASLWLKNQTKKFSISTGALGYKFGNLSGSYHNQTNAINLTFETKDAIYGNRIALNAQYFNKTNPIARERKVGMKWSAMYKNYTISQLLGVYKKSGTYGIMSNTTFWPGRYIYANGEIEIPSKRLRFLANHTCSKTSIRFIGQLNKDENTFVFNITNGLKNVSLEVDGTMNKVQKEALLRTYILPYKQSFTLKNRYVVKGNEKGIYFKASHDNKNRAFAWYTGYLNQTNEKSIKANASILGKPFEAVWTYFNYTGEKGIKFNGSAVGKSVNSAMSYLVKDGVKSIRVNASALNKKAEAMWSYVYRNSYTRSLIFNANIMKKYFNAEWAFRNLTNVKSLTFSASGVNKTVQAAWTYLNLTNDKVLKFNASALNKSVDAFLSYSTASLERSIKFNASALNKTIESALTFLNLPNKKSIKLNATLLNKTMEVVTTLFNMSTEKALQFSAKGFNKSATTVLSYSHLPNTKGIKVNATILNKTVEAAWTYTNRQQEKVLKFSASAMNKTAKALWTYFSHDSEKGLRFNAESMNKKIEGVWSYFNNPSEKGVKFNATVLKRTANATLAYFKLADNIGVRFNASTLNRSIGLMTKMLMHGNDKKIRVSGSYQNYSIAMVAVLKNLTQFKSLCVHSEFLSRPYGQMCMSFSNRFMEKSIAFNVSILNRTAEVKVQRFKEPNYCSLRLTGVYNRTTYLESWISRMSTDNMKTLVLNTTIANRSVDARWFMEYRPEVSERLIGFNLTVLNRTMGLKSVFVNQKTFKEASLYLMWNKTHIASSSLIFHNYSNNLKVIKLRNRIASYIELVQGEYRLRDNAKDFELIYRIRNGSKNMFFSSSLLTYKNQNLRIRELNFLQSLTIRNRSFAYGWDLVYVNGSYDDKMDHQLKAALMYSRGKKVSLTGKINNDRKQLSTALVVEYLPQKTIQHSIVLFKERKMIKTTVEFLPRIKIVNTLAWNNQDGVYVRSITSAFNKNIDSFFRYTKSSESYDGKFEFLPKKSITFNGQLSRKNGLLITSSIRAFNREWSHKLDIDKNQRKFFISIEVIPNKPVKFEASWNHIKGLEINAELSALKKSLKWNAIYENVTKTWTSKMTILKEEILFLENFDRHTKTLNVSVKVRNRRIGFVGRFDLKAYVVSAHLTCNQWMTGWFLKVDPKNRNIIYNATLTSRISGQVVAEMPNNTQLQVTFQRKFGFNIVNESRIMYMLSPEASRVFLTWNTTTVDHVVGKVQSLKPVVVNATMKLYNLTRVGAKNLTKKINLLIKNAKSMVEPQVMKFYKAIKSYNYNEAYKNISMIAKNISIKALNFSSQAYNISLKALKKTIKDLPKTVRNATELLKKVRAQFIEIRSRFMAKVPKITSKVGEHLSNVSRDLRSWGNNVSIMVGDIKIRNVKIDTMIKRVLKIVGDLQTELKKNITIQLKKLVQKVRQMEIRNKTIGDLVDEYLIRVRKVTWNDLAQIPLNISRNVMKMKIRNKTVQQHFISLKEKANNMSIEIRVLSTKLINMSPRLLRNFTIQAIHLVRNISSDIKNITQIMTTKIGQGIMKASTKVQKYTKPLTSLIIKISISAYNRAKPQILTYFENTKPMVAYVKRIYKDILLFNKPMLKPFGPFATELTNQILNITVKKIPIGVALDKTVKITVNEALRLFKELNHTIVSNVTTVVKFLNELSKKTPEEIIDITIVRVLRLVNHTKQLVNKTIKYTLDSSKKALNAYRESMIALEKSIKKVLYARPEELVELSIQKIQLYIQNITAFVKNISNEVQSIAKQIQNLDLTNLSKKMWKEIDLVNRFRSLALDEKWNKTAEKYMQHLKSLDLKERALAIKGRANEYGSRVMQEIKEIAKLGERAFILTKKFVRMEITREDFVKELVSIAERSKMVAMKHFHIAKNTTFVMYNLHNKYWNAVVLYAKAYKTLSMDKLKEGYRSATKYVLDFYKEHEKESREAFEFYKAIALDIYDIAQNEVITVKKQMDEKMIELKKKLMVKLDSIIHKLRKYENLTFEEMAIKVYQVSQMYGLELYKNYSIKVLNFYKKTRNLTSRAYNLTKSMAVKYYNLSRTYAVRIFNTTKNLTVTYYKISRNMTARAFHVSRNMTIQLYNVTRNITLRGIKYLNTTVKPKLILYFGKGKLIVIKAYRRSHEIAIKAVNDLKVWYANNKEKTVEELYNEAYGAVNKNVYSAVEKMKAKVQAQLVTANKTLRNITFEVMSVLNQTKNVSVIAGKQLVVIFLPYGKVAQNKTIVLLHQVKNMSILLMKKVQNFTLEHIKKAKNFTLVNLNKAKNFTVALYRNITNRKDFKEFMTKHQIKERYAKIIAKVKETTEKIKSYIQETRPKLETKYKEALYYINVTLPGMIKQKKEEILANPREYLSAIYRNAASKFHEMIKDTLVEQIIMHEIWSEYLEEMKEHEIVEVSGELIEYGKVKANLTLKNLKEKIEVMKIKAEELKVNAKELAAKAKKMVTDTKQALKKGFIEFKEMKLREIIEHKYVLKTIELAKNTTFKIQNVTLQVKNITLKWAAIGKVYYKNITDKARVYSIFVKKYALQLKKNYTVVFEKFKVIAKNYTLIARNITMKAWKIARNFTIIKFNATRMWFNKTTKMSIKVYKMKIIPYYKNKVLPFYKNKLVPMFLKYRKFIIDLSKNMSYFAYNRTINSIPYKFTIRGYNFTVELLRNVSKMTPRQSIIKIKHAYIGAYKFTLKSSSKLMNLSIEAYRRSLRTLIVTRAFVVNFVNDTIKAASKVIYPVLPALNFTKHEIIETAIFLNKYYGVEESIRTRVKHHYQKFQSHSEKYHRELRQQYMKLQNHTEGFMLRLPGLMKASAYGTLDLANKTIRYMHYTIRSLNATISRVRNAIPNYIHIEKGVIILVIPHPRPVTGDIVSICNDACNTVRNIPETARNMSLQVLNVTKTYTLKALNISKQWREAALKTKAYRKVQNVTNMLINMVRNHPITKKYLNTAIHFLNINRKYIRNLNIRYQPLAKEYIKATLHYLNVTRKYIRELNFTKIAHLTKSYAPIAFNMTKKMFKTGLNATRIYTMKITNIAWNISADIYNSTCPRHALMKVRNYTRKALNESMKHYRKIAGKAMIKYSEMKQAVAGHQVIILRRARSIAMKFYNMTMQSPVAQQYLNSTIHFFNITRNFVGKVNLTKVAKLTKTYVPKAFNVTRDMCKLGVSAVRNFTIKMSSLAWNTTTDIYNSTCLKEALLKARKHSINAYNEAMKMYRILYRETMIKYAQLNKTLLALYKNILEHELTKQYLHHARRYYGHSMKIIYTRTRHLRHLKKYWHRRISHKLNHFKSALNPSYWIPPFNSTAMIFGKPHVYTFDSKYFRFPGYKNERCTYILARDVRDNKFTLMSQETALLLVTKDANVKIHSDGRVETKTKINLEGEKVENGYNSELPVQSANMTVSREGPNIVLRHNLGLEILCDVEHYLCTFNIARWYHGRLAGLLGTNNNEYHDEMLMPNNKIANNVLEFVNSWEITKERECHIYKNEKPKLQCTTKYSSRCKELFADPKSPLAPFFKTVNPAPFKTACQNDYRECDTLTPKDMKHCNTTAAYIELLKMKGEWVDHLPECGRCANHEMGTKWFQSAEKAIDMILIVPETQAIKTFAMQIPRHIMELQRSLEGYSVRFGLVSFGGKGIHFHPHIITINGRFLGNAEQVTSSIEQLKFSDTMNNETDGFEAIAKAAHFPFRGESTKILVLFTTSERFANPNAPCIRRMTKKLQMRDITLNVIGKYHKFRGEKMGQDYLGRMIYRKLEAPSIRGVPLPTGEYAQLMQKTKGSLFGITFFASDDQNRAYRPFSASYLRILKEQIKRDQNMCKECFCARGLVGEGRTICKINEHHKC